MTVLDWVANKRLKTPTAVAEWLVQLGENALGAVVNLGNRILQTANARITGYKEQLAQAEGLLPVASRGAIERRNARLRNAAAVLSGASAGIIRPQLTRLEMTGRSIAGAASQCLAARAQRLDSISDLLQVLSPAATLRRGYSITRVNGHAVSSVEAVPKGAVIETTLADGTVTSVAR